MATISRNYYERTGQRNVLILVALKAGVESYFYNMFFPNDTNRIEYSTTDFALQKRSSNSPWNNALLPFMNYRETTFNGDNDRGWQSFNNLKNGVYIDELGLKVRFTPVSLEFDSTLWFATERDTNIAIQKLIDDEAGETPINYTIGVNGFDLPLYGYLEYNNLDFKPSFDNNDWLINNKVSTIKMDFKVQTFLPMIDKQPEYALTEKVILDFGSLIGAEGSLLEKREAVLNHFEQSMSDFEKII